ncbi:hypothetical protein M0813_20436 [Anaeramoeba flamelloides]|uniref:Uncharacterized protein n=1 Tax=Anaeramoeba flamelloides TaxID=1746091 RepID=A0ABQ8YLL8_9EUKA|nr:hypothetical protein M0813_20436 [Anaeramoeba flamelloides]
MKTNYPHQQPEPTIIVAGTILVMISLCNLALWRINLPEIKKLEQRELSINQDFNEINKIQWKLDSR